ncbi:MAG: type II secretion system protein [Betaproteobacteria bacterium]
MSAGKEKGFTYVAVLILVATLGAVGAAYGELTSHAAQREREQELLFVGDQFRKAIASYYRHGERYPATLAELLRDSRHPHPVRHLRRIYRDPLTGGTEWGLVRAPDGGILGVHGLSQERPIKSGGFAYRDRAFADATSYAQWQFVHVPHSPAGLAPPRAQETRR